MKILSGISRKFLNFIWPLYKKEVLTYLFFVLSIISCIYTYYFFYSIELFSENPRRIISALYLDIAFIIIFSLLACDKIISVWNKRHKKGSRFTLKLIAIFSSISILPSILMCLFSSIFFHNGLESWFNERNQTVLKDSINATNSYLEENKRIALNDSIAISRVTEGNLERLLYENEELENDKSLGFMLDDLCNLKGIQSAILINNGNRVLAHTRYSVDLHFLNIKKEDLQKLQELSDQQKSGMILEIPGHEGTILSASCFKIMDSTSEENRYVYLITKKNINPEVLNNVTRAQSAYQDYQKMLGNRCSLEKAFTLMFFIVGLLVFVISVVLAISYCWKIINPISNLVDVSETIMGGDLSARAEEPKSRSEISDLTRAFNQMISQIHKQQNELIGINKELDEKVKFISNVLSGTSSGVIGLDNSYIYIWNKKAEELLGENFVLGENIFNIFPETKKLLKKINDDSTFVSEEIQYRRNNEILLFSVKIVRIISDEYNRYVITFDDLTNMVAAQRKAAWSEAARRVAHEIKNPLTPIQLSAERLRRKYLSQISEGSEVFSRLIDVIIKQVGDIKRLIDEFNFFARLPEPKFKKCNLNDICQQAILLMNDTSGDVEIHFSIEGKENQYDVNGDDRLLHQCLVNIIKNAINALSTVEKKDKSVWVSLYCDKDMVHIDVEDNGPGFPPDKMDVLTTPYFTLLPKGTGLGLAIVKKIIQDHKGSLNFEESSYEKGAKVSLAIPVFRKEKK